MSRISDALLPHDHQLLSEMISALDHLWLESPCPCGNFSMFPLKLLKQRHGEMRLSAALARLRCQQCRCRPVRLMLTNDPQSFASGGGGPYPGAWRVDLPVPAYPERDQDRPPARPVNGQVSESGAIRRG